MEYWAEIQGDKTRYCVSTFGRIWSSNNGIIKTPPNNWGYPHFNVVLNGKSKRALVHRMAAIAFLPNPLNKPTVNHKNGIRHDNRIENLEWATSKEQNQHSVEVLGRKGAPNYNRRKEVIAYRDGMSIVVVENGIREMARALGIPYQAIQTGIKHPTRTYFGWKFEILHDPKWRPKVLLEYIGTDL